MKNSGWFATMAALATACGVCTAIDPKNREKVVQGVNDLKAKFCKKDEAPADAGDAPAVDADDAAADLA